MTWWLVGGGILIYIAGSYLLMYRDLSKNAGPAGLGWFAFPLAPLMGPVYVAAFIRSIPRIIARAFKR